MKSIKHILYDPIEDPILKRGDPGALTEEARLDAEAILSTDHLFEVPPMLHIIDTATKGLAAAMPNYKDEVTAAAAVCKLIRKRGNRVKLLARCFNDDVSRHYKKDILEFRGWIHTARWNTVALSVGELTRIRVVLCLCWSLVQFLRAPGGDEMQEGEDDEDDEGEEDAEEKRTKIASAADAAINRPSFWGYMIMLNHLAFYLRRAAAFCESCPCHIEYLIMRLDRTVVLPEHIDRALRHAWEALSVDI